MKTRNLLKMKAALAAAALVCIGTAANAAGNELLDFEQFSSSGRWLPLLGDGDELYQGSYWMAPFSNSGAPRSGDLVGVVVDGTQLADTCFGVTCPGNNETHFLTTLNDAVLVLGRLDGQAFTFQGLDAGFLGAAGELVPSTAGVLRLMGVQASDGETLVQDFEIGGPDQFGQLSFGRFATSGVFASTAFSELYIYGGACDINGNCTLFDNNRAQFALDNLSVTAVPEPSRWLMTAMGLGVMGFIARRRLPAAARKA